MLKQAVLADKLQISVSRQPWPYNDHLFHGGQGKDFCQLGSPSRSHANHFRGRMNKQETISCRYAPRHGACLESPDTGPDAFAQGVIATPCARRACEKSPKIKNRNHPSVVLQSVKHVPQHLTVHQCVVRIPSAVKRCRLTHGRLVSHCHVLGRVPILSCVPITSAVAACADCSVGFVFSAHLGRGRRGFLVLRRIDVVSRVGLARG